MIVVDTNVIAYSFIKGDRRKWAERTRNIDPQWKTPPLWRHEFLNFLVVSVRQKACSTKTAEELWSKAVQDISECELEVDMSSALSVACRHDITAYDAQFITLSQLLGVICVTEDKELLRKFPGQAFSMKDFCKLAGG